MNNKEQLSILRHSAAHLLAHAVLELFPHTLLTIGPATDDGFFYDMLPQHNFKEEDLLFIETRMRQIVQRNVPITHEEISKSKARTLFADNPFKLELIDQIPGETVGLSRQGDFYDLCRGGHVGSTGDIQHFKLLNISGSYWRGNKNNQALQRITGTAFITAESLANYEKQLQEALLNDHRKLGKQLDLFSFHEEGVGFPFFHAKGKKVLNILTEYIRSLLEKHQYQEIQTPIILSDELWRRSGHYAHYKNNMYFCIVDEKSNAVRPMNCPGSILIYNERPRSYRELPLKLSEFGLVHRYELSGVLHGLFRVRAFTIDDAHIFCTIDQIEHEVLTTIALINHVLKKLGFDNPLVAISTKPENAMGSDILWQQATQALENSLIKAGIIYTIQEGEGAFYGPKIEFAIQDSMKRTWQCSTIQLDFFQPENFDLSYVSSKGSKERPVMIHRAILGSLERMFGILLEHYKGHLPFWLAPIQIKILTITDAQKEYARNLLEKLKEHGLRITIDETSDPISGQIKTAQLEKIPWMLVIGKKEVEQQTITLRYHDGKQDANLTLNDIIKKAQELL